MKKDKKDPAVNPDKFGYADSGLSEFKKLSEEEMEKLGYKKRVQELKTVAQEKKKSLEVIAKALLNSIIKINK